MEWIAAMTPRRLPESASAHGFVLLGFQSLIEWIGRFHRISVSFSRLLETPRGGGGNPENPVNPVKKFRSIASLRLKSESAFSLTEVTLALGVAAFCLTAIFGLLPIGISSNQSSVQQTVAAGVTSAIAADLRATPFTTGTSAIYKLVITGTTTQQLRLCQDGTIDASGGTNSIYLAYVTFSAPTATQASTPVRILITWPAGGDLNNNPPKNYVGSYEAVTTLERN